MNQPVNPFQQADALDEVLLDVAALIELSPRDRRIAEKKAMAGRTATSGRATYRRRDGNGRLPRIAGNDNGNHEPHCIRQKEELNRSGFHGGPLV